MQLYNITRNSFHITLQVVNSTTFNYISHIVLSWKWSKLWIKFIILGNCTISRVKWIKVLFYQWLITDKTLVYAKNLYAHELLLIVITVGDIMTYYHYVVVYFNWIPGFSLAPRASTNCIRLAQQRKITNGNLQ